MTNIQLNKNDAVYGRGRKKNHIRVGSTYRGLIERHWRSYSLIPVSQQKQRRAFVENRIISGVLKKGGRFIMREGDHLRQLHPEQDMREIHKKIQRALFNEKKRRQTDAENRGEVFTIEKQDSEEESDPETEVETEPESEPETEPETEPEEVTEPVCTYKYRSNSRAPLKKRMVLRSDTVDEDKMKEEEVDDEQQTDMLVDDEQQTDMLVDKVSKPSVSFKFLGTPKKLDSLAVLATSLLEELNEDGRFNRTLVNGVRIKPRVRHFEKYLDECGFLNSYY